MITKIFQEGINQLFIKTELGIYVKDPNFDIKRNRIAAEILQMMIQSGIGNDDLIDGLITFLLGTQNKNGSWNEIHLNYNEESALITSFVADALLTAYHKKKKENVKKPIEKAKDYILSQNKSNGFFLKSKKFTADHLNVDASCGAFLAAYGTILDDMKCLKISLKTAHHIIDNQFENGVYPYAIDRGSYTHIQNVACCHYQAVTLYYLAKIDEYLKNENIKNSMLKGTDWLLANQKDNGYFDWSTSGLLFSYYLNGAYAFSAATYIYASRWKESYQENAKKSLDVLLKNYNGLILRWEKGRWINFPNDIITSFKTANMGNYSLKHQLFRLAYASYRQFSRRNIKNTPKNDLLFNLLSTLFNISYTTVEPSGNFYDVFMTSECIDCLSKSVEWIK